MDDKFGSPELNDPTSHFDRQADAALKGLKKMVREVVPTVINREIGTTRVPQEAQDEAFAVIAGDITGQKWAELYAAELQKRGNEDEALEEIIRYAERGYKRMKRDGN